MDGEAKEECGVGVCVSSVMAVGGGAEAVKDLVSMMDANRLECVMFPVRSNPRKHGEQVRMEEDVLEASRFGNEQIAREESCGDQIVSVKTQRNKTKFSQQVVNTNVGLDTCEVGCLSPLRIKGAKDSSKDKKIGPDLKSYEGLKSLRPEEEKGTSCVDRTKLFCPNRELTQGTKRKFKKMARDKGKVQESVGVEKAQEVSDKRKAYNDTLFIYEGNV